MASYKLTVILDASTLESLSGGEYSLYVGSVVDPDNITAEELRKGNPVPLKGT